ncbi:MAG: carboxylating nicotinate-nucleotide diphosphorylase [Clostridioides sp.]|jgi:nicotinate-nucleotide pyrophosphorylase (carboxylating)|nr:carboxylating nicotinate-nucleotide diphosphorylase [Clostridioides sp.]
MNLILAKEKIKSFLIEDIGTGDLSSDLVFEQTDQGSGFFVAKSDCIVSGSFVANIVYEILGANAKYTSKISDGNFAKKGDIIGVSEGSIRTLLSGERIILNLMQRMSAIASLTNDLKIALNDPSIKICDTRKTVPGLRIFDKHAVLDGGGCNHRFGLYDGVMLKDNHIAYAGGIEPAVQKVREKLGHTVKIEVEVETQEQVIEAVRANADIIMFDNRTPDEVREFVKLVPTHIVTEISGGITLENIHSYKGTGANYISTGMMTHSVIAKDISFNKSKGIK